MAFSCCCCDHCDYTLVRPHVIRTGDGRQSLEGPREFSSSLVSCTKCSHVSVHPVPSQKVISEQYLGLNYWEDKGVTSRLADRSWVENLTSNGSLWERYERSERQLKLILDRSKVPADAKIIDLGTGLSPFLFHCQKRGFKDLYGVEPSEEICRYLSDQGLTAYPMLLEDFITRGDLPRFDVMVLSHALEHLTAPDVILKGLRELLSDRGVFFITVPYEDHLKPWTPQTHLHFFNEVSMAHLLKKCGYRAMFVEPEKYNALERTMIKAYHLAVGAKKKIIEEKLIDDRRVQRLHEYLWRPLRRLLRLNVNIYVSTTNLLVLARR